MPRLGLLHLIVVFAAVSLVDARIIFPSLPDAVWTSHNARVKTLIAPIHANLSQNLISPSTAARKFSDSLSDYLSSDPDFSTGDGGGGGARGRRQNADISDEALRRAKAEKKRLRRLINGRRDVSAALRREFYESIRTHNFIKRQRDKSLRRNDAVAQERALLKDFWSFAKKAVVGRVGREEEKANFSRETANEFFTSRYSTPVPLAAEAVAWFPSIPIPETPFDATAIRPRDVRGILQRKKSTSAPGEDGILNGHLKHLDATHIFLATLFSKTLLHSPEPWEGWSQSNIALIHKAGDTMDPKNFRPIALTSTVGKLFHQLLADRISGYVSAG